METLSDSNTGLFCQKCSSPIKIHESFDHITENVSDLKAFFSIEDTFNQEIVLPVSNPTQKMIKRFVSPDPLDSTINHYGDLSYFSETPLPNDRLKVASYLFDYLSGHTELDHPLCQDCADTILNAQDQSLKHVAEEMAALQRYLDHLKETQPVPPSPRSPINAATEDSTDVLNAEYAHSGREESLDNAKKELEELSMEEEKLLKELESLMSKEKQIEEDIAQEKANRKSKAEELDNLTADYNKEKLVLLAQEDELKALDCKLKNSKEQLERLKKTNVLNLAFNIWYEGHMGVINGLRLGRLPSNPVEWPEINAAWGQSTLLLSSLAKKMNFNFQKYRLVPMGSTSSMINLTDNKELPLYHTGGVKLFGDSKFDQAMVAYMDCVSQLQNYIENSFGLNLPYKFLDKGRIQDLSNNTNQIFYIRLHMSNEENWTKALKCLLITLKWCLGILVTRQATTVSNNSLTSSTITTTKQQSTSSVTKS